MPALAGFINMLCFSKLHTLPSSKDFTSVDVLDRGSMSYKKAIGQNACRVAVEYCANWVDGNGGGGGGGEGGDLEEKGEQRPHATAVLDPFCGHGSVLGVSLSPVSSLLCLWTCL
jgi:hypothetical protein